MSNITRYLLEETSKYENNYTHFFSTLGSDSRMSNENISTVKDIGPELNSLNNTVTQRLSQFEQCSAANHLIVHKNLLKRHKIIKVQ